MSLNYHAVFINFTPSSLETGGHTDTIVLLFHDILNWHSDTIVALDRVLGPGLLTGSWSVLLGLANAVVLFIVASCWSSFQNLVILVVECVTRPGLLLVVFMFCILCITVGYHLPELLPIILKEPIRMVKTGCLL